MAIGRASQGRQSTHHQLFTVPGNSGDYAGERITVGRVAAGVVDQSYQRMQVVVDGSQNRPFVNGCVVEVWFPRVGGASLATSAMTDADYTFGGTSYSMSGSGMYAFELGGYSGFQVRVKSGGPGGVQSVSVTAQ